MIRALMTPRGWVAASAAALLLAAFAWLGAASLTEAGPAQVKLTASPATVAPGGTTTVTLSVTPASGEQIGGVVATMTHDESKLLVTACTPAAVCQTAAVPSQVSWALFDTAGLSGDEATVTLQARDTATGTVTLALAVTDCDDVAGEDLPAGTCAASGTTLTIQAPGTATPTGTGTATASPTASPRVLPPTGGEPSDGSTIVPWLLAALGLAVIGGGIWAVARIRRENS